MSDSNKPTKLRQKNSIGLLILFACLLVWTLLIAVGTFQTQASTDFRRPLIVIASMSIFLGGWWIALRVGQHR